MRRKSLLPPPDAIAGERLVAVVRVEAVPAQVSSALALGAGCPRGRARWGNPMGFIRFLQSTGYVQRGFDHALVGKTEEEGSKQSWKSDGLRLLAVSAHQTARAVICL